MPKAKAKGEKQIKKSVSKKKESKPSKTKALPEEKETKKKSPPIKNRPSSVKKDVPKAQSKGKAVSAQRAGGQSLTKNTKKEISQKKKDTSTKPSSSVKESTEVDETPKRYGGLTHSKRNKPTKSTSRGKERERSRSKSAKEEEEEEEEESGLKKNTPTKSGGSTPSKQQSSPSSKSSRAKKTLKTGYIPKEISVHSSKKEKRRSVVSGGKKKIAPKQVKESSSNIESSSSIDLSAEQKKRQSEFNYGPDSQRISQEVEEVIKRIENKKKMKKGSKMLNKKRKKGESDALVETHTAKEFDYILQKNPNSKTKPYINLEDLSTHPFITYSDILLALLEVGQNSNSYLFAYSSKSRCFWSDVLEYTALKKIFADFKSETLRKYWSELSKYDSDDATDLIKKNKSYLDKLPLKLGTIVSSISKLLSGKIKDLKEYINNIQIDIRKREIFEHEFQNPVTGELTKVKEVRTTYNTKKKYEVGNTKDFNGSVVNITSLKEVYHQNSNLNDFQKVMKNIKKEDTIKNNYLNEKIEEEKKKLNTINEENKFIFKAIDNVLDTLSSEFKNYTTDFILDTLQQNSMDIYKTYICLKEPMKNKNVGFTPLDDKVLIKKQGEEYKILLKEKGKDSIQEREEFLSH